MAPSGASIDYAAVAAMLGQHTPKADRVEVTLFDNGFLGAAIDHDGTPPGTRFLEPFVPGLFHVRQTGLLGVVTIGVDRFEAIPANLIDTTADSVAHGTHVAGLVLGGDDAVAHRQGLFGNGTGYWLKLNPLNVGNGGTTLVVGSEQGIASAMSQGAGFRIVNMSIAYGIDDDIQARLGFIEKEVEALYVVAAGNAGDNAANYVPAVRGGAGAKAVITVAAHDGTGRLAPFTNFGDKVDIAAPGCALPSWAPNPAQPGMLTVVRKSGTSMAAPLVAFQAALLRRVTGWNNAEIKARILMSGDALAMSDWKREHSDVANVWSRMRINVLKSLDFQYDIVRWRDHKAVDTNGIREVRGRLIKISKLSCIDDQKQIPPATLLAYRRAPDSGQPFVITGTAHQELRFCRVRESGPVPLIGDGEVSIEADGVQIPPFPLRNLVEIVRSGTIRAPSPGG